MRMVYGRMFHSKPVGFILTRENHENGWPHLHGIAWWPKYADNSMTLTEGRLILSERVEGKRYTRKVTMYNELGRVEVYPLRTEPYIQYKCPNKCRDKYCKCKKDETPWDGWFDYIMKDQEIPWREANVMVETQLEIQNLFSKPILGNSSIID